MTPLHNDPFQAIADPHRRHILNLLSKKNMTINALAGNFEMSRPAVSKNIKILAVAGFITIEDQGRERHCSLRREGFHELQDWINHFDKFWETKLSALDKFLSETTRQQKKRVLKNKKTSR